jgi:hypothetical protein
MLVSCQGVRSLSESSCRFEIPDGVTVPWVAVSPGGRAWAYAELRRSEAFVVAGGRRLGPYS